LLANRKEIEKAEKFLIDYQSAVPQEPPFSTETLSKAIERIVAFLIG